MLTLLSPAGLWALAALALPLALHLWRRPPRTVRLGSLRFLERLSRRRPRDLRWRESLLLAVRLLLLALLALMLTRPHWRPPSLDRPQHWALLDPNAKLQGGSLARLRALQAAGYETHLLAARFPRRDAGAAGEVEPASSRPAPDLWSLLREAEAGLPAGSALAVFTPGRLASLRGERPALARCQVEWVITPDQVVTVPGSAAQPPPGTSLKVVILHDGDRSDDARYLAAAVRAVARVSGRDITVTVQDAAPPEAAAVQADWAFWLGDRPPAVAANVGNLVTEATDGRGAPPMTVADWIVPQPGVPGAGVMADGVRLWQRVPASPDQHAAVFWTDSHGQPLLTLSVENRHQHWRFFSRFDPAWTDLPRTTALPGWLRAMLLPQTNVPLFADPVRDLRLADPAQFPAASARADAASVMLPLPRETPGLQGWCWLLAAILFVLERLLSHRRRATVSPVADAVSASPVASLAR